MRPQPGVWLAVIACLLSVGSGATVAQPLPGDGLWQRLDTPRSALLRASGASAYRVTQQQAGHDGFAIVVARGQTEYYLPRGLNEFLDEAGLAADGEAAEDIAQLIAQSSQPGEELTFGAFARVDERGAANGEHYTRRLSATTAQGRRLEWRLAYGRGALAGQLRAVEQSDTGPDGARRSTRLLLSPMRPAAGGITFGGNSYVELGYRFMLVDLDGVSAGNQVTAALTGMFDGGGAPEAALFAQFTSIDPAYHPAFFGPVAVAIAPAGTGTVAWSPPLGAPTGAAFLELGHMVGGVFEVDATRPTGAVFFENARDLIYPGGAATKVRVHYCEAFFQHHPLGTAHTEPFVANVLTGLTESWQSQVVDWSLAQGHTSNEPEDADGVHHVYVNDHQTEYRKDVTLGAGSSARTSGDDRLIWIRNDGFYAGVSAVPYAVPLYTNESIRTRSAIAHEFYHLIQAGWINSLGAGGHSVWIVEAQARAIPTIQYPAEEFIERTQHFFPIDANRLLRRKYNAFLDSTSYEQSLYWRFLFDRNQSGTTAQRVAIFRRVCLAMNGLVPAGGTDYVTPAVGAIDAALAADGGVFTGFMTSRDSLAHTVWRHDYPHPNPGVIEYPVVEDDPDSNRVSAIWSGPPIERDSVLHYPWGVDYWNFQVDPAVALRRLSVSFDADPDRDHDHCDFHLTILLYNALGISARVAVIPRGLAFWDSTFEVHPADSVVVIVHRVDMRAGAFPYRLRLSHPLAVDAVSYDDIGGVLTSMGARYRFDGISETDLHLSDFPWNSYDVLFLNCSNEAMTEAPLARDSLRAFVRRGGYLYVSDYDKDYIQQAWPGAIEFGPKEGLIQDVSAQITDPGLAAVMQTTSTTVTYDLNQWVTVTAPGPHTRVHMLGNYQVNHGGVPQYAAHVVGHHGAAAAAGPLGTASPASTNTYEWRTGPLMLSFADGDGRVIYTTFHNHSQLSSQQRALLKYMIYQQTAGALLAKTLAAVTADWNEWLSAANGISPGETLTHELDNPYNGIIEVILNWGGSNLRLTARRPDGSVAGVIEGPAHPIKLSLPAAEAGLWHFDVTALEVPDSNYAYAIVVAGPDALPGVPLVESIGETFGCPGVSRLVPVPVRNLALHADDFVVHASSDLGWTVEPADTTIHAWEGMSDSLQLRLTPPAGVTLGALDSVRVTLTSVLQPAQSASGARAVRVSAAPPVLTPPAPAHALRGADQALLFTVTGVSGCDDAFLFTLSDSLGWLLHPIPGSVTVTTGASYLLPGVSVPSSAPVGSSNPVTLTGTRIAGGMAPFSAVARVFVSASTGVLVVDPSAGYYGSFVTAGLAAAGRLWTPWTGYGRPSAAVMLEFPSVLWLMGGSPLLPPDTLAMGGYLRGGGRLLVTGQSMLSSPYGTGFSSGYGGAVPTSDGGGTLAIQGHAGAFLSSLGHAEIQGPEGAWNQFSPDELSASGDAFAVLDYADPLAPLARPLGGRLAPGGVAALWRDGAEAAFGSLPAISMRSRASTTGIAAVARDAGTWRMVTCGFGVEAIAPLAARASVLEAMLHFLEAGSVGVPQAPPTAWALAAAPNPSAAATTVRLSVPVASRVRVTLHDIQGRLVKELFEGPLEPGIRSFTWDGRDGRDRRVSGGIYVLRVAGEGDVRLARRIIRY